MTSTHTHYSSTVNGIINITITHSLSIQSTLLPWVAHYNVKASQRVTRNIKMQNRINQNRLITAPLFISTDRCADTHRCTGSWVISTRSTPQHTRLQLRSDRYTIEKHRREWWSERERMGGESHTHTHAPLTAALILTHSTALHRIHFSSVCTRLTVCMTGAISFFMMKKQMPRILNM